MVFKLFANGPLPSQKQVLTVSENKRQLIHIIVEALVAETVVPGHYSSRLIITGKSLHQLRLLHVGLLLEERISRQLVRKQMPS